jgi:hypothetical protein
MRPVRRVGRLVESALNAPFFVILFLDPEAFSSLLCFQDVALISFAAVPLRLPHADLFAGCNLFDG